MGLRGGDLCALGGQRAIERHQTRTRLLNGRARFIGTVGGDAGLELGAQLGLGGPAALERGFEGAERLHRGSVLRACGVERSLCARAGLGLSRLRRAEVVLSAHHETLRLGIGVCLGGLLLGHTHPETLAHLVEAGAVQLLDGEPPEVALRTACSLAAHKSAPWRSGGYWQRAVATIAMPPRAFLATRTSVQCGAHAVWTSAQIAVARFSQKISCWR